VATGAAGLLTRAAATQDGVELIGRAGGTTSLKATITPTTLTASRTITLPDVTGTVITTGDSGTVTSTMIANGTILDADINASAAVVDTKLATISTAGKVSNSATTATSALGANTIVARDGSNNFSAGTITAALTGAASSNVLKAGDTMTGVLAVTAGTAALPGLAVSGDPNSGIYSPGGDQLAISTGGTGRLFVDASGNVGIGAAPSAFKLDVRGGQRILSQGGPSFLEIGEGTTTNQAANIDLVGDTTYPDFGLRLIRGGGGANAVSELRHRGTGELGIIAQEGAPIAFYTDNTRRVFINSIGGVGIGTTGPVAKLHVEGDAIIGAFNTVGLPASSLTGGAYFSWNFSSGNAETDIYNLYDSATESFRFRQKTGASTANNLYSISTSSHVWSISNVESARIDSSSRFLVGIIASPAHQLQVSTDSAGKPSTNTWTIVSDERIKEDIELANLDICYDAVKNIPLKRFKWKDEIYTEEQVRDRHKIGWIAQDVEAVFPKAVGAHQFKYNQVFEDAVVPAVEEKLDDDGNIIAPAQPERIEQQLISEDVIEDCRNLNSDQIYAAMYGAIQKLIGKVESLEVELAILKDQ
jgi:hypothetical protein